MSTTLHFIHLNKDTESINKYRREREREMLWSSQACKRARETDGVSKRENNIILKAITMNSPQFRHESSPLSLTVGQKKEKEKKKKGREKKKTAPWDAYRWVTGDSSPLQGGFYRQDSNLGADNAHTQSHTHGQTHCNLSQCDNERGNEACVEECSWVQWGLCW